MDDELPIQEEQVIDEVLGDNPRASQLRLMRGALEQRRTLLRKALEQTSEEPERERFRAQIKALRRQIEALRQEESVTEFVEASVRVTLRRTTVDDDEEE